MLVEVPHAGLEVPDGIRGELSVPIDAMMRDADIYVDRLYQNAPALGAVLLTARASRYVVDLNRASDDVDAATVPDHPTPAGAQPRGVVWRATTDGRPILRGPLTHRAFIRRLSLYYFPYHEALEHSLTALRAQHGFAILLAAHSMPSTGRSLHPDSGARRADVVPGTQGRTTAAPALIDLVDAHFREAGLVVRHDDPYKGGYSTSHYGRPGDGFHAIQVELNRALYVNERTCEPREAEFAQLQTLLDALVTKLCALEL